MRDYWYAVVDLDPTHRYRLKDCRLRIEDAAEACAEDFHDCHDGWECSWPLTFSLYESEVSPEVVRFSVERETVPQFSGRQINISELVTD